MKMMSVLIFATMISGTSFAGTVRALCDYSKEKQTKTVRAHKGDLIVVSAMSKRSTGYGWVSKEKLESTYESSGQPTVGGGGVETFEIEASNQLDGKVLTFEYKRAWETQKPVSVCKVKVVID